MPQPVERRSPYSIGIPTASMRGEPGWVVPGWGGAASVDLNGDLVYLEQAGYYGAYFVVSDYSGDAAGHYGDSIEYVSTNGTLLNSRGFECLGLQP